MTEADISAPAPPAAKKPRAPRKPKVTTRDQAERVLLRLGTIQREITRLTQDTGASIAVLQAALEEAASPLKMEAALAEQAVREWFVANRPDLLPGKSKTLALATGTIAAKAQPQKVTYTGTDDELVEALEKRGIVACIRFAKRPDLTELKKRLELTPDLAEEIPGLTLERPDEKIHISPI